MNSNPAIFTGIFKLLKKLMILDIKTHKEVIEQLVFNVKINNII